MGGATCVEWHLLHNFRDDIVGGAMKQPFPLDLAGVHGQVGADNGGAGWNQMRQHPFQ